MAQALILTAPAALTNPLPDTPILPLVGDRLVLTSDGFSGPAGSFTGRTADAAMGGKALPWNSAGSGEILKIDGAGRAAGFSTAAGNFFNYIEAPAAMPREIELALTLVAKASAASQFYVDLFRDNTNSATSRKLRMILTQTALVLVDSNAGASTTIPGTNIPTAAGDRITLGYNTRTGALKISVNGAPRAAVTFRPATPYTGTMFGFAGGADIAGLLLDSFSLTETVI